MKQEIRFDPVCDIQDVDQFGFVDIVKAFQNGYVPGNDTTTSLEFSNCDDPSAIVGKPTDAFEAMRMQDSLVKSIKGSSDKKSDEN